MLGIARARLALVRSAQGRHADAVHLAGLALRRQLAQSEGLAGYSLDAHLLAKTFWTVSAWTGRAQIEAFVRQEPHAAGMAAIRPHMGEPSFVFWTVTADELPLHWKGVRQRVEATRAGRGERH